MTQKIINHFKKVDPVLYQALIKVAEIEQLEAKDTKDFFISLVREIISQQLSGKVAEVIFERFKKLFPKGKITAKKLLELKDQQLRDTGMSWSKVSFLKDLAEKVTSKKLKVKKLQELSDEQVMIELMKVKGIGRWTAEMFLMFCLGREDVFSLGDQGLKNAIKKIYGMEELQEILVLSEKWKPYRSYACRILWDSLDNR